MVNKYKILTLFISLIIIIIIFPGRSDINSIRISFLISTTIACVNFLNRVLDKAITIRSVHDFFILVFFCLTPFFQWESDIWIYRYLSDEQVLKNNLIIILYQILYAFFYSTRFSILKRPIILRHERLSAGLFTFFVPGFFLIIGTAILINSPDKIIFATSGLVGDWGPSRLVFQFFVQPMPFFVMMFLVYAALSGVHFTSRMKIIFVVSILAAAVWNSPLGSARFYIFTLYYSFFIVVFSFGTKRGVGAVRLHVLGLLPLAMIGSYFIGNTFSGGEGVPVDVYLYSGNFDAYEMLAHIVAFGKDGGMIPGQLFGALLFFLPREFLLAKVEGTGSLISKEYLALPYSNISAPILAEFILGFGLIGIVLIALMLAKWHRWSDRRFSNVVVAARSTSFSSMNDAVFVVLHASTVPFTLILLRGDFLSSLSSGLSLFVSCIVARFFVHLRPSER